MSKTVESLITRGSRDSKSQCYFSTLPETQPIQRRTLAWYWTGTDVEGSGYGVLWYSILACAWRLSRTSVKLRAITSARSAPWQSSELFIVRTCTAGRRNFVTIRERPILWSDSYGPIHIMRHVSRPSPFHLPSVRMVCVHNKEFLCITHTVEHNYRVAQKNIYTLYSSISLE